MSESDKTTQGAARVLLLPATLRRGVSSTGATAYQPRQRLAAVAMQRGDFSRANKFRGWLYKSWAGSIAARWQMRCGPGARPDFIYALRPSGTIERRVQSPSVHLHRHAHTSLVTTQFNLQVSTNSAPSSERQLLPVTLLERTLVAPSRAGAGASVGAGGRANSLSSVVALIEQRYRRVTMPEASGQARETLRREVAPPPTNFVFRREAHLNEPGRRSAGKHEPPSARSTQIEPRTSPGSAHQAATNTAAPRLDVDVLTEQVMQRMQRRLTAQRERMGRA